MAGILTAAALQGYKEYTERVIAYAKYKIGGTYYKTDKPEINIREDGIITVDILIDHNAGASITVTEIQLWDIKGQLWASKPESITRASVQEGILYRFKFNIIEA